MVASVEATFISISTPASMKASIDDKDTDSLSVANHEMYFPPYLTPDSPSSYIVSTFSRLYVDTTVTSSNNPHALSDAPVSFAPLPRPLDARDQLVSVSHPWLKAGRPLLRRQVFC